VTGEQKIMSEGFFLAILAFLLTYVGFQLGGGNIRAEGVVSLHYILSKLGSQNVTHIQRRNFSPNTPGFNPATNP
jgi:small basic protein